jgi:hypothetical protein
VLFGAQAVRGCMGCYSVRHKHTHTYTHTTRAQACAWPLWHFILLWHSRSKKRNNTKPKSGVPRVGIDPAIHYLGNHAPTTTPHHSYKIPGLWPHWHKLGHIGLIMVGHIGVTLGHFGLHWPNVGHIGPLCDRPHWPTLLGQCDLRRECGHIGLT